MRDLALANLAALLIVLVWLATLVLPARQALRVRNAFLLRRGGLTDFAWTPEHVPCGYRVETSAPPQPIAVAIEEAGVRALAGDWSQALALVTMLIRHARQEGHVRADLATTYREILTGRGSCADYVRVYLAAAAGVGLFCRQWSFSFDGFGGHGHTFVEVYDRDRGSWAFLDVHNNVYAVEVESENPVDALTLRRSLLEHVPRVEFRQVGPGRLGWPHFAKLTDYYRRGAREWYLSWGNDVIARERGGGRWGHRVQSALGRLPPMVALITPENEAEFLRMERLRRHVYSAALIALALAVGLLVDGNV